MSIEAEQDKPMTSTRPYMVRAFYEWIVDNACTPYLLINSTLPHVHVPSKYIDDDGTIVFNLSPVATNKLVINNEHVRFSARFDGEIWDLCLPMYAILAIYAHENGQGMVFEEEEYIPPTEPVQPAESTKKKAPHLTVVK